jgi:hypothetical protein
MDTTPIIQWLKAHKKQLLIAIVVATLGMILLNQLISFQFKAQLLADPCVECVARGYDCVKERLPYWQINFSELNITK